MGSLRGVMIKMCDEETVVTRTSLDARLAKLDATG
jgi:hypothetical protein